MRLFYSLEQMHVLPNVSYLAKSQEYRQCWLLMENMEEEKLTPKAKKEAAAEKH